ncbi:MAG: phosphoribosylpyrophosphate synthetase [Saprospiraceae bacterium]
MESFETLSETMTYLREQGYTEDFNLKQDCIECLDGKYKILIDEFNIDQVYRFEGDTDPADESILYAISASKFNLKGVLVHGYGIYNDTTTSEMTEKLRHHLST